MRYKIRDLFPQMILVLADCAVVWQEREKICEFYNLLRSWPSLNVDTAVELLDGRYVDLRLRAMAIEHLDNSLNDDQLRLYLLVLIQAIRYEPHMDSPLVNMLVRRSLLNYHVGHTVFWLLRAELAHFVLDPACSKITPLYIRFALMLEAYCRGNSAHLDSLMKQVTMMSTLTTLSITIRGIGNKDIANKKLQQELFLRKDSLQNMCSPLNPTDSLGELIVENCRVLGSAKMPLKLTWTNPELLSEISIPTHELLFKNGDDLRQDMLTLQVMRIMDSKWKNHNIDYCMTLYEVLPMGRNIGLIQVVQNCQTLYQIQCVGKQVGSSLNMDVASLNKHIYQKCAGDSKQYMECVDRFAGSLAGYCIATYVIGIKDRHHDNIMLAQDGRIFHIDFGHFLGHTKTKLGINRERTEFILTDHFLYVISKGKNNFKNTHEYNIFRESTTRGFMIIYHHARFFIALFRMMLCMGLPELTDDDVTFLRSSLMYDEMDRDKAGTAFKHIFEEVVKSDWATSINWFFHSVKHI
ncbi:phosphatidylinositol 3- and 4-kinase domain-containing protein [Ditylenchus destructor]|nr:phosphatidylinositol 3- and 4-kinase domain-containing protein [Ditylenchus destructor]